MLKKCGWRSKSSARLTVAGLRTFPYYPVNGLRRHPRTDHCEHQGSILHVIADEIESSQTLAEHRGCRLRHCSVSTWPAISAKRVLAALLRIGWQIKRQSAAPIGALAALARLITPLPFTTMTRSDPR